MIASPPKLPPALQTSLPLAPRLETARLVLRPLVMADYPAYAAFLATDRAVHMGGPLDARQAWAFFTNDVAQWMLLGMGALMADLRSTGETIGQVAVCHGPLFPEPELGWFLYEGHQGKGYAREAASALQDWAFDNLHLTSLVSYVDPANTRSARLAERLGGVLDPDAPTPGSDPDLTFRYRPKGIAA